MMNIGDYSQRKNFERVNTALRQMGINRAVRRNMAQRSESKQDLEWEIMKLATVSAMRQKEMEMDQEMDPIRKVIKELLEEKPEKKEARMMGWNW